MLTHVVLFRFADLAVASECRDRMLAMKGHIPPLLDIEVGVDIVRSDRSFDLALITRHEGPPRRTTILPQLNLAAERTTLTATSRLLTALPCALTHLRATASTCPLRI